MYAAGWFRSPSIALPTGATLVNRGSDTTDAFVMALDTAPAADDPAALDFALAAYLATTQADDDGLLGVAVDPAA